jgi:hypothetical protein
MGEKGAHRAELKERWLPVQDHKQTYRSKLVHLKQFEELEFLVVGLLECSLSCLALGLMP